ncbi:MAG: peptidoglycan-binding protein [Polyangiaceae bacterium]
MSEQKLTFGELNRGIELAAGEAHRITLLSARRLRLVGLFFELDKCFLLPSALPGLRRLTRTYEEHPDSKLLVVGHTDTSGKGAYNLTLSLERADAVAAYLSDDTAPWEAFFSDSKPEQKRWGTREVQFMLSVLPEAGPSFFQGEPSGTEDLATKQAIKDFQGKNGLLVDGVAGPLTRSALIRAYMKLDGTSLPAGTTLTTHGCGENFPVSATGDGVRNQDNRRVEVFFFDGPIEPPPPGKTSAKGSTEYPRWLAQVEETFDVGTGAVTADALRLRVHANPKQVLELDDQFRLFNDAGFEQFLEMPADADEDADSVDLLFRNVPVDESYSLEVVRADDDSDNYLLLENVPFDAIEGSVDDSQADDDSDPLALEPEDPTDEADEEAVADLGPRSNDASSADAAEDEEALA